MQQKKAVFDFKPEDKNNDYYQSHPTSNNAEQVAQGVTDLHGDDLYSSKFLNFVGMATNGDIHDRAFDIARIASESGAEAAMIGGAPYLMPHLQKRYNHAVLQCFTL